MSRYFAYPSAELVELAPFQRKFFSKILPFEPIGALPISRLLVGYDDDEGQEKRAEVMLWIKEVGDDRVAWDQSSLYFAEYSDFVMFKLAHLRNR